MKQKVLVAYFSASGTFELMPKYKIKYEIDCKI